MKKLLTACILLWSGVTYAQPSQQLASAALRYFIALPYGKTTTAFLQELAADTSLIVDPKESAERFRARFRSNRLFPEADSAGIQYGRNGTYWKNRSTGATYRGTSYNSLIQVYRVPKDRFTWKEWKDRCMTIVRDLGSVTNRKDLNLITDLKVRGFTFSDREFRTNDINIRFGEAAHSDHWFFLIELMHEPPVQQP
ncbi:hypothetical protein [Flaviaesturariibacter amylovorans]|uniref:Uncharacterized protein n=1 Tax=Flaviaesturariibacter amylovorans TaxID=1084520 RepID=A0ABP8GGE0_9BACT